jgi:type III secretory pathway lipoprotein EscJ
LEGSKGRETVNLEELFFTTGLFPSAIEEKKRNMYVQHSDIAPSQRKKNMCYKDRFDFEI